jgi:hypothetical protein
MLCCKKEDALSGREQSCIKQEGEIKNQVKELKMRSVALQQKDNALMNCKILCHKKKDALSKKGANLHQARRKD